MISNLLKLEFSHKTFWDNCPKMRVTFSNTNQASGQTLRNTVIYRNS